MDFGQYAEVGTAVVRVPTGSGDGGSVQRLATDRAAEAQTRESLEGVSPKTVPQSQDNQDTNMEPEEVQPVQDATPREEEEQGAIALEVGAYTVPAPEESYKGPASLGPPLTPLVPAPMSVAQVRAGMPPYPTGDIARSTAPRMPWGVGIHTDALPLALRELGADVIGTESTSSSQLSSPTYEYSFDSSNASEASFDGVDGPRYRGGHKKSHARKVSRLPPPPPEMAIDGTATGRACQAGSERVHPVPETHHGLGSDPAERRGQTSEHFRRRESPSLQLALRSGRQDVA